MRHGTMSFASGDAGFLEVSIEGMLNPIKIFEPLVQVTGGGPMHRAELYRWVADPFANINEPEETGGYACGIK